jgi:hypothetical protein
MSRVSPREPHAVLVGRGALSTVSSLGAGLESKKKEAYYLSGESSRERRIASGVANNGAANGVTRPPARCGRVRPGSSVFENCDVTRKSVTGLSLPRPSLRTWTPQRKKPPAITFLVPTSIAVYNLCILSHEGPHWDILRSTVQSSTLDRYPRHHLSFDF